MILVTGIAGFIGMHLASRLLAAGEQVMGVDNLNHYYDPALKKARLEHLRDVTRGHGLFFGEVDLTQPHALEKAVAPYMTQITHLVHLAAQAGVRYSLEAPRSYVQSNVAGTLEVLELCRTLPNLRHLVYASSSSVYGANREMPFETSQRTDRPVSLYAATKKSAELLCESYARLFGIPSTGLRFFTVYGPWGRPDMAYFKFTRSILAGEPIQVYHRGQMRRDFTYVDDVVDGVTAVLNRSASGSPPHQIYNLGNHRSELLTDMIALLEQALGRKAEIEWLPMQPGDVQDTFADITDAQRDFGFAPKTTLREGLPRFVEWYRGHYG